MIDWKEHDGGPQPVADDVWVAIRYTYDGPADQTYWWKQLEYRILNQHLIDAARLEGIRLGLEAAANEANVDWFDPASRSQARLTVANIPATIAKENAR